MPSARSCSRGSPAADGGRALRGTGAYEERRQLLQMNYTEAAGERSYDTSGCPPDEWVR
jgi:hypothetical protein